MPGPPPMTLAERERRFWARVDRSDRDGCWPWTGPVVASSGYGQAAWWRTPRGAHRVAFELANGPVPDGMYVCHTCDNPICCRPDHLYAGTPAENAQDRIRRGRDNPTRGVERYNAKLTADQVREIRRLHATGRWSYPKLAERFGLHPQNVGRVVRREGYADIA